MAGYYRTPGERLMACRDHVSNGTSDLRKQANTLNDAWRNYHDAARAVVSEALDNVEDRARAVSVWRRVLREVEGAGSCSELSLAMRELGAVAAREESGEPVAAVDQANAKDADGDFLEVPDVG